MGLKSWLVTGFCLLVITGCLSKKVRLPTAEVSFGPPLSDEVPSPKAFGGWKDLPSYTSGAPLGEIKPGAFACDRPELYPTHPQQLMKTYHLYQQGSYNHFQLSGDDDACRISAKKRNSSGRLLCLAPDEIQRVVFSDIYEDTCGNTYRGYQQAVFFKRYENMGTLFSAGRTLLPTGDAFAGEMEVAHTYGIQTSDLMFVVPATDQEIEKARAFRAEALKTTHVYDSEKRTFSKKPR